MRKSCPGICAIDVPLLICCASLVGAAAAAALFRELNCTSVGSRFPVSTLFAHIGDDTKGKESVKRYTGRTMKIENFGVANNQLLAAAARPFLTSG